MRNLLLAAATCLCAISMTAQKTIVYQVILRSDFGLATMWDGTVMPIYSMNPMLSSTPQLPARTLYANEGDTVILNVRSVAQGHHHTVHLHGLDVDTRNDGDPATSFSLSHMQDTTYTFIARHAGTYLYHCHVGDVVHVQMGMYGLIVVKAAGGAKTAWTGGPAFDSYRNWLMSEIDQRWHDTVPEHDTATDYIQLPVYQPNYFLINGKSKHELGEDSIAIHGAQNEVIYLRLGNIGFFDNRVILPAALNAVIIDSDGRPLPSSIESDTVWVSPGERFGLMLRPQSQFVDSVRVEYVNMNTGVAWNVQHVPVVISGYFDAGKAEVSKGLRVFPNPSSGTVTVQYPHGVGDGIVTLYNTVGDVIRFEQTSSASNSVTLDLRGYSSGLYVIDWRVDDVQLTTKLVLMD